VDWAPFVSAVRIGVTAITLHRGVPGNKTDVAEQKDSWAVPSKRGGGHERRWQRRRTADGAEPPLAAPVAM